MHTVFHKRMLLKFLDYFSEVLLSSLGLKKQIKRGAHHSHNVNIKANPCHSTHPHLNFYRKKK